MLSSPVKRCQIKKWLNCSATLPQPPRSILPNAQMHLANLITTIDALQVSGLHAVACILHFYLKLVGMTRASCRSAELRSRRSNAAIEADRNAHRVAYANRTNEERLKRILSRRRNRACINIDRAEMEICNADKYATVADADIVDERTALEEITDTIDSFLESRQSVYDSIYKVCTSRLSNASMSEKVCCVCDALHTVSSMVEKYIARCPSFLPRMVSRLVVPHGLPRKLVNYYDC